MLNRNFAREFNVTDKNRPIRSDETAQHFVNFFSSLVDFYKKELEGKDIKFVFEFTSIMQDKHGFFNIQYDAKQNHWLLDTRSESIATFMKENIYKGLFSNNVLYRKLYTQIKIVGEDAKKFDFDKFILKSPSWQQLYPAYFLKLFDTAIERNDIETVRILFRNGLMGEHCKLDEIMKLVTNGDIVALANHRTAPIIFRLGIYQKNKELVKSMLLANPKLASTKPTREHVYEYYKHRNILASGWQFPTPLEWTAAHDDKRLSWIISALEKKDLNIQNNKGQSALHIAFEFKTGSNFPMILERLLQAGVDPNIKDNKDKTILDYMIKNFIFEDFNLQGTTAKLIKLMLETYHAIASPKYTNLYERYVSSKSGKLSSEQETFLYAAKSGYITLVKDYIRTHGNNPKNLNICNSNGSTALNLACDYGHAEVVDLLIAAGADVDLKRFNGRTPLMAACDCFKQASYQDYCHIVKSLIRAGANINKISRGAFATENALSLAVRNKRQCPEIVSMLVNAGATIQFDYSWDHLYKYAIKHGHHQVANILENGLLIQKPGISNHMGDAKLLLDANAIVDYKDANKEADVFKVARENRYSMINLFINKKNELIDNILQKKASHLVCPILRDIFIDPITLSNGQTFERSAIISYANSIVGGYFMCPITRKMINKSELHNETNHTIKNMVRSFLISVDKINNENDQAINKLQKCENHLLVCPLTKQFFNVPITLSTGHTYELSALRGLAQKNPSFICPNSKKEIDKDELTRGPCYIIKTLANDRKKLINARPSVFQQTEQKPPTNDKYDLNTNNKLSL